MGTIQIDGGPPIEMKPCPFCRGSPKLVLDEPAGDPPAAALGCSCGARGPYDLCRSGDDYRNRGYMYRAIEKWNRRTTD